MSDLVAVVDLLHWLPETEGAYFTVSLGARLCDLSSVWHGVRTAT